MSWFRPAMRSPAARAVLPASFDPAAYRIAPNPATHVLHDNDVIDLGGRMLRVLHIPGHSPGHVAYVDEASYMLFTGILPILAQCMPVLRTVTLWRSHKVWNGWLRWRA